MTSRMAHSTTEPVESVGLRGLTEEELTIASGGRTNGDDPLYQVFLLSAKATFYQGMWYQSNGW
jgi:hypothetical protein